VTVVEETMRALVCRAYGGPESLTYTEHPAPALGAGEIRIAIRAAGVNFADLMAIDGVHQNTPPAPFIPGFEVAGVVDAVGTGVKAFSPGNRVVAASGHGAFAELLVCPESHVAAIGDDVGFVSAAAAPIAFGTAYVALVHRAMLRSGEWLFVQGAGGNIGGGALQIGKLLGARTIATADGPEGCVRVRALGADFAIDHRSEDVPTRVRELTNGRGAAIIFDSVTGDVFTQTLDALARGGRLVVAGAAGGSVPSISLMELIVRHVSLIGVDVDDYLHRDSVVTEEFITRVADWLGRGLLRTRETEAVPLSRGAEALARLKAGEARRKLVLVPDEHFQEQG
jgi:NADPH:quinone reductase